MVDGSPNLRSKCYPPAGRLPLGSASRDRKCALASGYRPLRHREPHPQAVNWQLSLLILMVVGATAYCYQQAKLYANLLPPVDRQG